MSVTVHTSQPRVLLDQLYQAIDEEKIRTWKYDSDGDLTHTSAQWRNKAWMSPQVSPGKLVFHIVPPKLVSVSVTVYAVYHGNLIQTLLSHFDKRFRNVTASALPTAGDKIKGGR
jgi:hypothetical protein